jgi:antitoxin VapB
METAKITKKGQQQVLSLPHEFHFEGNEVYIKRIGRMVVLIPKEDPWEPLINSLSQFTEDFMSERNQPPIDERESL